MGRSQRRWRRRKSQTTARAMTSLVHNYEWSCSAPPEQVSGMCVKCAGNHIVGTDDMFGPTVRHFGISIAELQAGTAVARRRLN
jgi:hypothetical protein